MIGIDRKHSQVDVVLDNRLVYIFAREHGSQKWFQKWFRVSSDTPMLYSDEELRTLLNGPDYDRYYIYTH